MSDLGLYEAFADELEALLRLPITGATPTQDEPWLPQIAAKVDRAFSPESAVNIDGIVKPAVLICPGTVNPSGGAIIGNRTMFADYTFLIAVVTEAAMNENGRKLAVVSAWRILELIRDRVQGVQSACGQKKRWRWGGESFIAAVEDDAHVVMAVRYTVPGTVGND